MIETVHLTYKFEFYDDRIDDYIKMDLKVTCNIYPMEPETGYSDVAILRVTDGDARDMFKYLDEDDKELIKDAALEVD